MKPRRILVLTIALFVLVALACTRSASGPMPRVTVSGSGAQGGALPTQVALQAYQAAEQDMTATAMAATAAGETSPTEPPTPVPPAPTPTTVPAMPPTPTPVPPTATPVVVAPSPTPQTVSSGQHVIPAEYVLHQGEFPYCIARRFNIHPEDLLQANGISPWQYYFAPGTRLRIPQNARPFTDFAPRALRPHPTTYTVRGSGETLYSIACKFGDVWPEDIAQANGLPLNDEPLAPGTVLHIP